MIDYTHKIIRSKRRSISLSIDKDASLEIRAPLKASLKSIKDFIKENRTWIEKKMSERKIFIKKYSHLALPSKVVGGEKILYEGKVYGMKISDCMEIIISDIIFFPRKFIPLTKQYLTIWLKHKAFKKISERANHFASIARLQFKSITITSAKGIWGSCNAKGALNVNWRLIMAPPEILDYIIVHELIHLVEKNHSKTYWDKVKNVLPDYKEHEKWLKNNGDILML